MMSDLRTDGDGRAAARVSGAVLIVAVVVALLFGVASLVVSQQSVVRTIWFAASYPALTVSELIDAADVVAVVQPTGDAREGWNSADGREWSSDDPSRPAYIYRDETVTVERVLLGSFEERQFTLRQVGGQADGVRMLFENAPELQPEGTYLVFLREYDTPTETGAERFWTVLWQDRGVFERSGQAVWTNPRSGVVLRESDLAAITSD